MASISEQEKKLIKRLIGNVNEGTAFIKSEAEKNTPEDKKILVKNFETISAIDVGDKIIGKVKNETKYAFYVEFGTRRAKKYHKPKGKVFFYSGDYKGLPGARMLTRAVDENRTKLSKILNK